MRGIRRFAAVVLLGACALIVVSCGGDDQNDAVDEFLSLTQGDIPEPVAECLVERLDDEVGLDRIQRMSPNDQADFGRRVGPQLRQWLSECSVDS